MAVAKTIAELGPVMQLAFVPHDFAGALRYWTEVMGAGPFFSIPHVEYVAARYRGAPSHIDFSIHIGYWGDMQIELIEQHCDSPSIYRGWLDERREGMHHVCLLVDDIGVARATVEAAGLTILQEVFLDGGGEGIYVDSGGGPGSIVEILQPMPGFTDLCAMMRDAHRDWDGSDPLRALG